MPEFVVYALVFGAVALFVLAGVQLFGKGWETYEERYVSGASRSLEALWLTIPPQHLLYLSVASALALGLAGTFLGGSPYVGMPVSLLGFAAPKIALILMRRRRDRLFDQQLVHALGNMTSSLKGGQSLPQAIDLIAREMDNPIRQEFGLVSQQMRLGMTLEEALAQFTRRMPSKDLDLLATSIVIAKEVGGNLSEIFEKIAGTIRERHRIEGRIKALSAMGRMQGIVMAVLPVAILVYLGAYQPQYVAPLFDHPIGLFLLAGSAAWMGIGAFFIYRILSIEV